ncbi:hypothetical protein Bateq7PJ16_4300 [Bacillus subtilis]|nr:hypothetical protein Bateq7PJ16_4300 [Bacillus subtilis]
MVTILNLDWKNAFQGFFIEVKVQIFMITFVLETIVNTKNESVDIPRI